VRRQKRQPLAPGIDSPGKYRTDGKGLIVESETSQLPSYASRAAAAAGGAHRGEESSARRRVTRRAARYAPPPIDEGEEEAAGAEGEEGEEEEEEEDEEEPPPARRGGRRGGGGAAAAAPVGVAAGRRLHATGGATVDSNGRRGWGGASGATRPPLGAPGVGTPAPGGGVYGPAGVVVGGAYNGVYYTDVYAGAVGGADGAYPCGEELSDGLDVGGVYVGRLGGTAVAGGGGGGGGAARAAAAGGRYVGPHGHGFGDAPPPAYVGGEGEDDLLVADGAEAVAYRHLLGADEEVLLDTDEEEAEPGGAVFEVAPPVGRKSLMDRLREDLFVRLHEAPGGGAPRRSRR